MNSTPKPSHEQKGVCLSLTFSADRGEVLFLPPPWEDPELLLPDLSLPSIPWLLLGPTRCCPIPRRRPSWRLSLDIDSRCVQWLVCVEEVLTDRVISLSVLGGEKKNVTIYESENNRTQEVWELRFLVGNDISQSNCCDSEVTWAPANYIWCNFGRGVGTTTLGGTSRRRP